MDCKTFSLHTVNRFCIFFISGKNSTVTHKYTVVFFSPPPHQFHINFNNEQFYIKLPDGHMMNFPNRLGDVKYKYFDVAGDAKIIGIKIK